MRLSIADIDWTKLSERERWTIDNVTPRIENGFTVEEIAQELGEPAETIANDITQLAARIMALSGRNEMPAHAKEEYAALKASIEAVGQLYPILKGSPSSERPGEIIDGHARNSICAELRIAPLIQELDGSAEELTALAVVVNVARRHLSSTARRGIIKVELLRNAERSDRAIATAIGVSPQTVTSLRRELEQKGLVLKLSTRVGKDGVAQPAGKAPSEPPTERSVRVIVAAELFEQYVGPWVSCKAFRLVERRPGVHELQVQLLASTPATWTQVEKFHNAVAGLGIQIERAPAEITSEILRTASDVFGRQILQATDFHDEELEWALTRLAELQAATA